MAALQREARGRLNVRGKAMCARAAVAPPAAQVKKKPTRSAAAQILCSIKQLPELRALACRRRFVAATLGANAPLIKIVPGPRAAALPRAVFLHDPNVYLNAIRRAKKPRVCQSVRRWPDLEKG
jgi:hypothetical protein